jgi:acid phosphatase family membrane protein YuiD
MFSFARLHTRALRSHALCPSAQFDSGGMPSSHTSLVVGLATSVALTEGLGSPLFVLCLAFALIVMYDAAGVRRHAGKQAEVLNALVEDYFQGHPVSEQELKEVLGHTPLQVAMGALLGVVTAIGYHKYLI